MKRPEARATREVVVDIRHAPAWRAEDRCKAVGVQCRKASGLWVLFSRYASMDEAIKVRDRLAEVGCPSRIVNLT